MKLKLYDYLELKYKEQSEDYRDDNRFDDFIEYYLDSLGIVNDSLYETVFGDNVTYHYRNYEVDHTKRTIDILFLDEDDEEDW